MQDGCHNCSQPAKAYLCDPSQQNLSYLNRNSKEFLRRFVAMDETWIHHYTSVFWDAHGIIFIDCFEKGRTIIAWRKIIEVILLTFRSKLEHMDKLKVI